MSDTSTSAASLPEPLWLRFVYMIGFGILAHIAFSLTLFLGVVQLVVLVVTKQKNEELLHFSRRLFAYVGECLAFVVFARDEKPFPLGRFPGVSS
jgi:hypothetical protein